MDLVEVERRYARKAYYNARGVVGLRCILNLRHYRKTHYAQHFDFQVFLGVVVVLVCFTMVNIDAVC